MRDPKKEETTNAQASLLTKEKKVGRLFERSADWEKERAKENENMKCLEAIYMLLLTALLLLVCGVFGIVQTIERSDEDLIYSKKTCICISIACIIISALLVRFGLAYSSYLKGSQDFTHYLIFFITIIGLCFIVEIAMVTSKSFGMNAALSISSVSQSVMIIPIGFVQRSKFEWMFSHGIFLYITIRSLIESNSFTSSPISSSISILIVGVSALINHYYINFRIIEEETKESHLKALRGDIANIKAFYSNVLQYVPHGIAFIDDQMRVQYSNNNLQSMLNCQKNELLFSALNKLVWTPPQDISEPGKTNANTNTNKQDTYDMQRPLYKATASNRLIKIYEKKKDNLEEGNQGKPESKNNKDESEPTKGYLNIPEGEQDLKNSIVLKESFTENNQRRSTKINLENGASIKKISTIKQLKLMEAQDKSPKKDQSLQDSFMSFLQKIFSSNKQNINNSIVNNNNNNNNNNYMNISNANNINVNMNNSIHLNNSIVNGNNLNASCNNNINNKSNNLMKSQSLFKKQTSIFNNGVLPPSSLPILQNQKCSLESRKNSFLSDNGNNLIRKASSDSIMISEEEACEIEANNLEGRKLNIKIVLYELDWEKEAAAHLEIDDKYIQNEDKSNFQKRPSKRYTLSLSQRRQSLMLNQNDNSFQLKSMGNSITNLKYNMKEQLILMVIEDLSQAQMVKKLENQNEYKMRMLASVSHELRTPLNCSIAMLQIMRERLKAQNQRDMIQNNLDPALYSSQLLLNLINDILDFAQLEAGKFRITCQDFNLKQILYESLMLVSIQSKMKNINLCLQIGTNQENYSSSSQIENVSNATIEQAKFIINSDPNRVRQIVLNLLSNALKFTSQGSITLKAKIIGTKPLQIKIICEDTGIGIPSDRCLTIFDNFNKADLQNRIKYNQCGAGLGLSISNQLAKMLCPQRYQSQPIKVESVVGKGSSFSFVIQDQCQSSPQIQKVETDQEINVSYMEGSPLGEKREEEQMSECTIPSNVLILPKLHQQSKRSQFSKGNEVEIIQNKITNNNNKQKEEDSFLDNSEIDFIQQKIIEYEEKQKELQFNKPIGLEENDINFPDLNQSSRFSSFRNEHTLRDPDLEELNLDEEKWQDKFFDLYSKTEVREQPMSLEVQKNELLGKKEKENIQVKEKSEITEKNEIFNVGKEKIIVQISSDYFEKTNTKDDIINKSIDKDSNQLGKLSQGNSQTEEGNSNSEEIKIDCDDHAVKQDSLSKANQFVKLGTADLNQGYVYSYSSSTGSQAIQPQSLQNSSQSNRLDKDKLGNKFGQSKSVNIPPKQKIIYKSLQEFKSFQSQKKCGHAQVLVVDDNQFNIIALQHQLSQFHLQVDMAFSGEQAIQKIKQRAMNKKSCCQLYMMVFMDIDMPVMNGYTATEFIQKFFNEEKISQYDCPVVACSAYVNPEDKQSAYESGMLDYITKPIMLGTLDKVFTNWFVVGHSHTVSEMV